MKSSRPRGPGIAGGVILLIGIVLFAVGPGHRAVLARDFLVPIMGARKI